MPLEQLLGSAVVVAIITGVLSIIVARIESRGDVQEARISAEASDRRYNVEIMKDIIETLRREIDVKEASLEAKKGLIRTLEERVDYLEKQRKVEMEESELKHRAEIEAIRAEYSELIKKIRNGNGDNKP